MRIAHCQHERFYGLIAAQRTAMWAARAIGQLIIASRPSGKPFVADIGADPVPPTQLAPVHPFLHCSRTNSRRWSMTDTFRHGMDGLPGSRIHAIMCQSCLRTPVSDLSGLNRRRTIQ
jgi:hypothetical protein